MKYRFTLTAKLKLTQLSMDCQRQGMNCHEQKLLKVLITHYMGREEVEGSHATTEGKMVGVG